MLLKQKLYESATKRIRMSVWKHNTSLVMHLQEVNIDPSEPGVETFMLYQAWSKTVAREACARATKAAIDRFYAKHIEAARALVAERVKVLEAPTQEETHENP
jgi:hypothetical protein